jgi:hypothetical protein
MLEEQGLLRQQAMPQAPVQPRPIAPAQGSNTQVLEPISDDEGDLPRFNPELTGALIMNQGKPSGLSPDRLDRIRQARADLTQVALLLKGKKTGGTTGLNHPHHKDGRWTLIPHYCEERQDALITAMVASSSVAQAKNERNGFSKFVFGERKLTLKKFEELPELESGHDLIASPRLLWQLGELMLLQQLRDGKSSDLAHRAYDKYLKSAVEQILAQPATDNNVNSLSYRQREAASEVKKMYEDWVAPPRVDPNPMNQSVLEVPKIGRGLDVSRY